MAALNFLFVAKGVPMPLQPGTILENRYRVEALLGQGGMGAPTDRSSADEVERCL